MATRDAGSEFVAAEESGTGQDRGVLVEKYCT
jgi:hypothetical protein